MHARAGKYILNSGGAVGAYLADALYFAFGYLAYFLPLGLVYVAWLILQECHSLKLINRQVLLLRSVGFMMVMLSWLWLIKL